MMIPARILKWNILRKRRDEHRDTSYVGSASAGYQRHHWLRCFHHDHGTLARPPRRVLPFVSRVEWILHLVPSSPPPPAGLSPPGTHPELCRVRPEPCPGPRGRLTDESDARGAVAESTQQVRRSEVRRAPALAARVGLYYRGKQDPA